MNLHEATTKWYIAGPEFRFINQRYKLDWIGPFEAFLTTWKGHKPSGVDLCQHLETIVHLRMLRFPFQAVLSDPSQLSRAQEILGSYEARNFDHPVQCIVEGSPSIGADDWLRIASFLGDPALTKGAFERGAQVDHPGPFGMTATHWAAATDHAKILEQLISQGADLILTNTLNWDAVDLAEHNNAAIALEFLRANGALRWERPFDRLFDRWGLDEPDLKGLLKEPLP